MLKAVLKQGRTIKGKSPRMQKRRIPPEVVAEIAAKLEEMEDDIAEIMKEEKEEKAVSGHCCCKVALTYANRCCKLRWS
jgi:ATP-dependent RNA helicase DDX27